LPFQALLENYLAVFLAVIIGIGLVATALIATRVLAPFSEETQKRTSYECGMVPIGRTRVQIHIRSSSSMSKPCSSSPGQ
jgi:NADH:ubiquinone oxidoreductase subunit 3 (subunit A)